MTAAHQKQTTACKEAMTEDFAIGVLCALAVVEAYGEDTLHDEIIRACGREELLRVARKHGDMRLSGMARSERDRRAQAAMTSVSRPKLTGKNITLT